MSEAEEKILEGDEIIGVEKISGAEDGTVKRTLAYIDRIEEVEEGEDKAVLYIGEETDSMIKIVLPISLLPDDAGEGDNVSLTITIDNAEEEDAAQIAEE
ncbi:MAG: DUF3006 family protein [Selenomonadaceae bacterium]|nr:DUF3006 family protein [Selenomonadaceae bacterium]MBR1581173.1 DUF3006 family protein [Selenomonadaceae bacterium]